MTNIPREAVVRALMIISYDASIRSCEVIIGLFNIAAGLNNMQ